MRYSSLFRSRWSALFWSVGILWSAISFVSDQTPEAAPAAGNGGDDVSASDAANVNQLQALVGKLEG